MVVYYYKVGLFRVKFCMGFYPRTTEEDFWSDSNLQLANQIWAPLGFSKFSQKLLKSAGSHVICRKWLLCLLLQNILCTVWQIKWIQSWSLKKLRRAQHNRVETPNVAINVSDIVCDLFQVDTNLWFEWLYSSQLTAVFARYEAPRVPNQIKIYWWKCVDCVNVSCMFNP